MTSFFLVDFFLCFFLLLFVVFFFSRALGRPWGGFPEAEMRRMEAELRQKLLEVK